MKKKLYIIGLIAFAVLSNLLLLVVLKPERVNDGWVEISMNVEADSALNMKLYYLENVERPEQGFNETKISVATYAGTGEAQEVSFPIPTDTSFVRFDPSDVAGNDITITDVSLAYRGKVYDTDMFFGDAYESADLTIDGSSWSTLSNDGYVTIEYQVPQEAIDAAIDYDFFKKMAKRILCCVMIDLAVIVLLWKRRQALEVPKEVWYNKKLVFNLAKNDFKSKFAGSYLGIVWAFVQPVVTVLVYWFVFEHALHAGGQSTKAGITVPFVVWLVAGMVPWFYHSDTVIGGTNVLLEYSYLVKKVVFNISTLPVVKAISALFVNLFFIAFALVLTTAYGFYPSIYTLQLFYYVFALMVLSLGIIYITSAAVVFFRDLSQIISIVMQIMNWFTPIMWNFDGMQMSGPLKILFKLNPLFYIVQGYRDSLLNKVWFWEHGMLTIYFWFVTILLFVGGTTIFRKLKMHFADVL